MKSAYGLMMLFCALMTACSKESDQKPTPATPASIERGRYLTQAADCFSCHSAPGKGAFSGGYALDTPFGTIYGPNITPDKETGIGRYSRDDFYRVLHEGRTPDGWPLYPAMPYTSYRLLTRQDSDAIYDYLMTLPPIKRANIPANLNFPYNIRLSLYGWQWLFLHTPNFPKGDTPTQQRGAYLSNALAHCAECHTPRGIMGQLKEDQFFKGALLGRYEAPDITPEGLAKRGWTQQDLVSFFGTGLAPQGSAYADMFAVVHNSTRFLSQADLLSLASYLSGPPHLPPTKKVSAYPLDNTVKHKGLQSYATLCAGCHGFQGEGKPHVAPALLGNSTLQLNSAQNLIAVILDGVHVQQFNSLERMQNMPPLPASVSHQEAADLVNTLRALWGGQPPNVTAKQISGFRGQKTEDRGQKRQ